ncbi:MAG: YitT family protein [Desulfatiglandaceae bacterium]
MTTAKFKDIRNTAWQIFSNLLLITAGSVLCAVAINGILIPNQFLSGGITGIAITIHYLLPGLPMQAIYFVLNIPIFILGWFYVGRRFFLYSIAGMIIFTLALVFCQISFPPLDKLASTLAAGIISGIGSGIVLRSVGSAGGLDILGVMLLKRFSIRLGSTILAFNSVILATAAVLFPLEKALYTLLFMYVTSHIVDLVVTGLSQRKFVFIVSSQWRDISHMIMHRVKRGVTIVKGQGGFTGREEQILYTVVSLRELSQLKQLTREIDPDAFVVVTDTMEVIGHRIGNQPHW